MDIQTSKIRDLVDRPQESLSVEIKRWIRPDIPDGIAKIVKGVIALRNFGGGYLVIGFDNETLEPDKENEFSNIRELFHVDKIQGMIAKYSSSPFEIVIEFIERNGTEYPVIVVPTGVKTPVATKSELSENGKVLIKSDTIYIRTLSSNNTASTTIATWRDWDAIIEICFDNREADIGRFLRRHLSGLKSETLKEFVATLSSSNNESSSAETIMSLFIQESENRLKTIVEDKKIIIPEVGYWEAALIIQGNFPKHSPNNEFLNLIDASNPRYTGWPVWIDSRGFRDKISKPLVFNGVWEAIIPLFDEVWRDSIDFVRFDPNGKFFLWRAYQEDMKASKKMLEPLKYFDFALPIIRLAETIGVGIAFAKGMKCDPENTLLSFNFKWTKLQGRELISWIYPNRNLLPGRFAYQNEVLSSIQVLLDTPLSAISEYVFQATQPLLEVFDGFTISKSVVEELANKIIERK